MTTTNGDSVIRERRVTLGGVSTRILEVAGKGPPIVLIHGFSDTADTWRGVLGELAARGCAAVAADLPGFGSADALTDQPMLPQLDAFLTALVTSVGAERGPGVVLVGNSLGSVVVLRAAQLAPERVGAVMAIGSPAVGLAWPVQVLLSLISHPMLSRFAVVHPLVPSRVLRAFSNAVYPIGLHGRRRSPVPDHVARLVLQLEERAFVNGLLSAAVRLGLELPQCVDPTAIQVPVTVVHCSRDVFVTAAASRTLAAQLPQGRLVSLSRVGHCPQLEDPDTVVDLILGLRERIQVRDRRRGATA